MKDFPFEDVNTLQTATIVSLKSRVNESVSLLRVKVKLSLFNEPPLTVTALLDNGSTHSFISPRVLSVSQLNIIKDPKLCSRENYIINGATGSTQVSCSVSHAKIQLGPWSGTQRFIITGAVHKDDMILGLDFLKSNSAKIDHGSDSIEIGEHTLKELINQSSLTWLNSLTRITTTGISS